MPLRQLQLDTAWLSHENGLQLGIPLRYPEISALGHDPNALGEHLARLAARVIRDVDPVEIHRRQPRAVPEVATAKVRLEPGLPDEGLFVRAAWSEPVELVFHYLVWDHDDLTVAYVPLLGIAAIAEDRDELAQRAEREILLALRREKETTSLGRLYWLQRVVGLTVVRTEFQAEVRTPKQIALGEEEKTQKSPIAEVATDLCAMATPQVFERDALIATLAESFAGRVARSVLLVGPSGVGKTALVHELCRRRGDHGLGRTPFWTTSGARIVAGMCGFGMWQQRCQAICREAAKTKAIVHLGNLMELLQVGRSAASDEGVAEFLRPYLERGELLAIAECTEEQRTILERDVPGLVGAFSVVQVEPPSAKSNRMILRKTAAIWSRQRRVQLVGDALKTLDRLHNRYCTYSALPGRPLRFLRSLVDAAARNAEITAADVTAAFARETGLPRFLLDEEIPLNVETVRRWFAQRIIGQDSAIEVVVDILAAAKAALAQPARPIASLLFIGPTGVGKTEMARSLAEFLYRDRRRMVRIDMSEYADPLSIDRLIGGLDGSEGVLTSKVREQPFGVVLLDEFEKAHRRFFDLLLQVLGEGRLTDASGRLADFRNSVIIMTSNLGSESFGRGKIRLGGADGAPPPAADHFLRAVQEAVRPELFNRIDRIVLFLPLDQEALLAITREKLERLRRREGIRFRNVNVAFGDSLAAEIVRLAYDPRYGARPIDRAIERHVLAPLGTALNEYQGQIPLEAAVGASGRQIQVRVRADDGGSLADVRARLSDNSLAARAVKFRREAVSLLECRAACDLRTQLERLRSAELRRQKLIARASKAIRTLAPPDPVVQEKIASLEDLLGRIAQTAEGASHLEERILVALYQEQTARADGSERELTDRRDELDRLYLELFHRGLSQPDRFLVALYSPKPKPINALLHLYLAIARSRDYRVRSWRIVRGPTTGIAADRIVALAEPETGDAARGSAKGAARLEAICQENPIEFFSSEGAQIYGLALEFAGYLAQPWFALETGRHRFVDAAGMEDAIVDTASVPIAEYRPPDKIHMRTVMNSHPLRRVYDEKKQRVEDKASGRSQYWKGKQLEELLAPWFEEQLMKAARSWVHAY